ncbi:unnamed protein product [Peniophora sp. CBMAI 1063]|nr:unnamed protein product [Peniophora sp. CBMAI 1063]
MRDSDEPIPKGHVCPPSNATHPRDRWETVFAYSFILKFTDLKKKVEDFGNVMDFEESIMASGPHPLLHAILARFVLNLRPTTRNTSADKFSATLHSVLNEYFAKGERTVFWDDDLMKNVDPLSGQESNSVFAAPWDTKLKIIRTLVELQLVHSPAIKTSIDKAWGVVHNKHKKKDVPDPPRPDPSDPFSQESLSFMPLGQDADRKRYWVVDDSPRVYMSTNPWKISSAITAVSSTRAEYVALLERLRAATPPEDDGKKKKGKAIAEARRTGHVELVNGLGQRLEVIDKEIARIDKLRKKAQQRAIALAQAEMRQTRTRRQTKRPDYVYADDIESDDGADDFDPRGDHGADDEDDFRSDTASTAGGRRRSARNAATNGNSHANGNGHGREWRGERRSARFAGPQLDDSEGPPRKRARTADTASSDADGMSVDGGSVAGGNDGGAGFDAKARAKIKDTETAVEQLAGRKKSKFWFYAVEPIPGAATSAESAAGRGGEASEEQGGDDGGGAEGDGDMRQAANGSGRVTNGDGQVKVEAEVKTEVATNGEGEVRREMERMAVDAGPAAVRRK